MKILNPILASEIPQRERGGYGRKNQVYDNLIAKVQKMSATKALPVECDNLQKAKNLYLAIRSRIKKSQGTLNIDVSRVDKMVYLRKIS